MVLCKHRGHNHDTPAPLTSLIQDYIVQGARFQLFEEFGCANATVSFSLSVLMLGTANLLLPLASLALYSRMHCLIYGTSDLLTPIHAARLVYTYFKHRKDLDEVLESNGRVVNRHSFLKLLALGLFDAVITLPLAIINLVQGLLQTKADGLWPGWNVAHADLSAIPTVTSKNGTHLEPGRFSR